MVRALVDLVHGAAHERQLRREARDRGDEHVADDRRRHGDDAPRERVRAPAAPRLREAREVAHHPHERVAELLVRPVVQRHRQRARHRRAHDGDDDDGDPGEDEGVVEHRAVLDDLPLQGPPDLGELLLVVRPDHVLGLRGVAVDGQAEARVVPLDDLLLLVLPLRRRVDVHGRARRRRPLREEGVRRLLRLEERLGARAEELEEPALPRQRRRRRRRALAPRPIHRGGRDRCACQATPRSQTGRQ
mmetsp:Transcript_25452/g.87074  ORF Transcript_25452/g.87074 Transcript_25452/m.87074 type:complete len:246 (-) Transcript_25452:4-741(-)